MILFDDFDLCADVDNNDTILDSHWLTEHYFPSVEGKKRA